MEKVSAFGMYRAKVVDNKDPKKFGKVLVWIPDIMPEVSQDKGIWARPANNPVGGRNMENEVDNYYMGSSFIPKKGSWVFIFFEGGNVNLPYYFGALDLENTKVLPENQLGSNYQDKWTLFKSHEGRAIVVSDDPDDARTEITGKKRKIKTPPTGDTDSVYEIDGNQTTILFDERAGQEKVLIRTRKGDFFHIDIDEQHLQAYFKNDIIIKCDNDLKITANGDIDIKSLAGDIKIEADSGKMDLKAGQDINKESGANNNNKAQISDFTQAGTDINRKAGGTIADDGTQLTQQAGAASGAASATSATEADPKGERNT